MGLFKKAEIEASLQEEQQMIHEGKLKEDNPLDLSENFRRLCEACRRGDLKVCQEMITEGANINARDQFDYTPLILASLCGHYEVVQLLLESGALCERDTFQGERCLYNALNDRIRNLLLSYDYSKTADPLQPFAAHITSLLSRDHPKTSDISVAAADESFHLHKFVLSARSPYFSNKLAVTPDTASWKLPPSIPSQAFDIATRYLYFGEIPSDVGGGPGTGATEIEILDGLEKITKQLEIRNLWDGILESLDRRLARQRRTDEVERGRDQLEKWYQENVLRHKIVVDKSKADQVRWDRNNAIFADVLLRADDVEENREESRNGLDDGEQAPTGQSDSKPAIPIGPLNLAQSRSPSRHRSPCKSTLFPVHRAMLLRSEYFSVMFSSGFREAQDSEYLQIIPVDCSPEVLRVILTFLYTEKTDFPLELAIDVLFTADLMLIEKLKVKAALLISTLGNGTMVQIPPRLDADGLLLESQEQQTDELDIYDVVRAGWLTRMPRLEEFGARYLAYRLESYIDEDAFAELVKESASRIQSRQETDTIELLDDIRYYLSERFRLRFEDAGIEEMIEENTIPNISPPTLDSIPIDAVKDPTSSIKTSTLANPLHVSSIIPPETDTNPEPQKQTEAGVLGVIRTLDGSTATDEMEEEARNYEILIAKIDALLDRLKLDA